MRVIAPESESHLPEDLGPQNQWYHKLLRRGLQKIASKNGVTVSVGAVFFVLCSIVMSMPYFGASKYIDAQGKSLQDIYAQAQLEVTDKDETNRKIERARQGVQLVYKDQEPLNRAMRESLNHILSDLDSLTDEDRSNASAENTRMADLISESPQAKVLIERLEKKSLNPEHWDKINAIAHATINKIMAQGITPTDYLERRDAIIEAKLPRNILAPLDTEIITFAIGTALQPNLITDETVMEQKRNAATRGIKQAVRVYRPGEKIVGYGDSVSNVQIAALQKMGKSVVANNWVAALGVTFLTLAFAITLWTYLYRFEERRFFKPSYASLVGVMVLLTATGFEIAITSAQRNLLDPMALYGFPLATLALTVSIFTHPRVGVMSAFLTVFLLGFVTKADFSLLAVLLLGGLMGVYMMSRQLHFKDRNHLIYAGLYIGLTNVATIFALQLLNSVSIADIAWQELGQKLAWGFVSGMLSGVLTLGILPILESIFRLVTPYSLMELANHDHPLLRRLQFEAPGTFHHSLMVASLSEAAAEDINADPLLTRVGCLYHDIGKMKRPLFFIENQAYFGADNPHDKLTPRLSKMVITAHPKDSIELGRQYRLPESILSFMTEHHGTMMAAYFYNKACQEEGAENVNKSQFRYPGPKPQSKETALVMLADACESAVRSLKNPSLAQIEERIDKIIWQRIDDGQFDNCPLTFKDIHAIKQTFIRILRGIQHNRIEYQQNIMRDLGRKLQQQKTDRPDPGKIDEMLKEIERSTGDKAETKPEQKPGSRESV